MIGVIILGVSALVIIFLAVTGRLKRILPALLRLVILGGLSVNALIGLNNLSA